MRAYRLAYDGRPYHGFQRQPDVQTVEGQLFAALEALDIIETDETPPSYAAAGRTDAGVSAVAQTVSFEAPDWLTPRALNSELPTPIQAWAHTTVPESFHATHNPIEREYTYFLYADGLDESRTQKAVNALSGEHDFHNLTPESRGTRRTLSIDLAVESPFFVLTLRAGGFARQLVRRIVSLVAEIGRSETPFERIDRVLSPEPLSGPEGISPAPAYPLVLTAVVYPHQTFEADPEATARAKETFDRQRIERKTGTRVASILKERINLNNS